MQALVEQYGVEPARLVAKGKGFSQPKKGLAPDAAQHRRVEVQTIRADGEQGEADGDAKDDGLGGIRFED